MRDLAEPFDFSILAQNTIRSRFVVLFGKFLFSFRRVKLNTPTQAAPSYAPLERHLRYFHRDIENIPFVPEEVKRLP